MVDGDSAHPHDASVVQITQSPVLPFKAPHPDSTPILPPHLKVPTFRNPPDNIDEKEVVDGDSAHLHDASVVQIT